MQQNGYKPQPLDTHEIELPESMQPLVEALARNTHNVWAREKIKRGWTFGISEVTNQLTFAPKKKVQKTSVLEYFRKYSLSVCQKYNIFFSGNIGFQKCIFLEKSMY
jgi:hypothetical protein